jgi:anti-sigma B factor antagonist
VEDSSILVRQEGLKGIARVVGKGSFKNARHLAKYMEKAAQAGVRDFVIDLQDCVHVDSTFMGVLAGMASSRRKENLSTPQVVNTSARNLELLQTLGLDRILTIAINPLPDPMGDFKPVETSDTTDKIKIAETMLAAHQNLIDLDEKNAAKFEDVMAYLKDKVAANDSAK